MGCMFPGVLGDDQQLKYFWVVAVRSASLPKCIVLHHLGSGVYCCSCQDST